MSGSKKDNAAKHVAQPPGWSIRVKALARVEGEGALNLTMRDGQVEELQLKIYEPPRFFEAFLRGRDFREVPDITARICGICPVAYQMGSCHALEKAMGVFDQVDPAIRTLRNLLYCGEWIESHVLHMFLLHLPDFLGFESAISMAADHGPLVKRSLRIKKAGNDIVALLGGRAVHPVGVCVGGFYRAPDPAAAAALARELRACLDDMCDITLFLAEHLQFPTLERDYEFVVAVSRRRIPHEPRPDQEQQGAERRPGGVRPGDRGAAGRALHVAARGRQGPRPLPGRPAGAAESQRRKTRARGRPSCCRRSARRWAERCPGATTTSACWPAAWRPCMPWSWRPTCWAATSRRSAARVPIVPRAGIGGHGTEAPRGICWHEYRTDADGTIVSARIIPPTSQNHATIEADLRALAPQIAELSDEDAALRCEHLIRNYDPCISCSVHFLRFSRTMPGANSPGRKSPCPTLVSILVAAYGNDLAADDAFGPLVAEAVRAKAHLRASRFSTWA